MEDGCGQVESLPAGEAFEETEYHVHRAMNLGTEDVEIYNTFIISAGNPTTVNIPEQRTSLRPACAGLHPVLGTNFCPGGSMDSERNQWSSKRNGPSCRDYQRQTLEN